MNSFIDYIENSSKNFKDNRMTYLYKRHLLDKMTERATEVTRSGLKDSKVLLDLLCSEFPITEAGYANFAKEEKRRQHAKLMKVAFPIGGLIALLIIFITYFTVSDLTLAWDKSWLIIVGGIFAMIIFYLSFAIRKLCRMRRIFHPIARLLIFGCVMLVSVFIFLYWLMMLPENFIVWPVLPLGVMLSFAADLIFAYTTKQKFRTVCFFIYMPVMATMVYIILAAYGIVTWLGGWPLILAGLVVDCIYAFSILMSNMKYFTYRQEDNE